MAESIADHVHLEKRRPQGMQYFHELLFAIRNRVEVQFRYEKYYGQDISGRHVESLALKEFESRWYLLARDRKDNLIKTFALDRISELEVTRRKFKLEGSFDVNAYFRHCFGIIRPSEEEGAPELLLLSFKGRRGKYIKSLPLHESQQIVKEDETETLVRLALYITHDLVMELLSHGDELEVIEPLSLKKRMEDTLRNTLRYYE